MLPTRHASCREGRPGSARLASLMNCRPDLRRPSTGSNQWHNEVPPSSGITSSIFCWIDWGGNLTNAPTVQTTVGVIGRFETASSELHRCSRLQYTTPSASFHRPCIANIIRAAWLAERIRQADSAPPTVSKYRSRLAWIAARASATLCHPFILAVFPSNSL